MQNQESKIMLKNETIVIVAGGIQLAVDKLRELAASDLGPREKAVRMLMILDSTHSACGESCMALAAAVTLDVARETVEGATSVPS